MQAQRRYREFVALHDGLRGEISGLPHAFPVWPFHLNRLAPEVVDGRRVALCSYLSAALAALHGGVMPARLRSFLQLPQAQANRMTAPAGPSGAAALLPLEKSDTVLMLVAYQLPLSLSRLFTPPAVNRLSSWRTSCRLLCREPRAEGGRWSGTTSRSSAVNSVSSHLQP